MKSYIRLTLLVSLCFISSISAQQISEGFETGLPAAYATSAADYTLSSGIWSILKGAQNTNKHGGTYALALSPGSPAAYATTPSLIAVQSITFWARGSGASTLRVQKSVDQGDFIDILSQNITSGYSSFTITINETSPDVRLRFVNGATQTHYIDDIVIVTVPVPVINLSRLTLPDFGNLVSGLNSPSVAYQVSGNNLLSDVTLITSAGFELSADNAVFTNSITLNQASGVLTEKTVYVRFSPLVPAGTLTGTLSHSSTGAKTKVLALTGTALSEEPTSQPSLTFGSITGSTMQLNFPGGNGNNRIVAVRAGNPVSWVPVDGQKVSGVNANFTAATDLGDGNRVIYDGNGTTVDLTGLAVATMWHFAVYSYNAGTGNSHNYLTTSPTIGSQSTPAVPGVNAIPSLLSFGDVVVNAFSTEKEFVLSGNILTPENDNLTVSAPAGFEVSLTAGAGFASSLVIPYTAGILNQLDIYARFKPKAVSQYSGVISIVGGGAAPFVVTVSGFGVEPGKGDGRFPAGFASMDARGQNSTTGGAGGKIITITDAATLSTTLRDLRTDHYPSHDPVILKLSGTLNRSGEEMIYVKDCKNVTIVGAGTDAKCVGFGFEVEISQNIIIRNIEFSNCPNDGIDIRDPETHHIWVDHCSFNDGASSDPDAGSHDGALDYKKMATHVTVSWNHFYNHSKTCLYGHTDNEPTDTVMCATYHHNWFEKTRQRHPRVRFGKAHVYNNFYDNNDLYGIASCEEADVMAEGNYFLNVPFPMYSGYMESGPGDIVERNNVYKNSGAPQLRGAAFNPTAFYAYTVDDPELVPDMLKQYAGSGKIDFDSIYTHIDMNKGSLASSFVLLENYPNPFNPSTTIEFSVEQKMKTELRIFDVLGKEVTLLFSGIAEPGTIYKTSFNALNLPSGIYISMLGSGNTRIAHKMLLLK